MSFDSERTARHGHADRFWAIALACQKERAPARSEAIIGVRVIGHWATSSVSRRHPSWPPVVLRFTITPKGTSYEHPDPSIE